MLRSHCKTMTSPVVVATVLIVLFFASSAHAGVEDAATVVTRLHDTLLSVMKEADALGVKGRYRRLAPKIERAFHLRLMARITSGAVWKKADTTQKDSLAAAFTRLSVATYASRFDGYSGQAFEIIGDRPGPPATHLVDTRILSPGESPVPLTYVLKQVDGPLVLAYLAKGDAPVEVSRDIFSVYLQSLVVVIDGPLVLVQLRVGEGALPITPGIFSVNSQNLIVVLDGEFIVA